MENRRKNAKKNWLSQCDNSLRKYIIFCVRFAKELSQIATETVNSSRGESIESLGNAVAALNKTVPALVITCKEAVANMADQQAQSALLDLAKDMADSMLGLLNAARDATTNPSMEKHREVASRLQATQDTIGALVASLNTDVVLLKVIN
jgi:cell division septum initiation protein DivIVA